MLDRLKALARRPSRFAMVGALNTTIDVSLFWILALVVGLPPLIANTCSYSAGVINSFVCNKFWTFGDLDQRDPATQQLSLFVMFSLIALGLSNLLVWLFMQVVPPFAAKILSIGGTVLWNYTTSRLFVYRSQRLNM